jgi:hypothetical protein
VQAPKQRGGRGGLGVGGLGLGDWAMGERAKEPREARREGLTSLRQTPARAVRLVWATVATATATTAPEAGMTSSNSAHQSADHSFSWPVVVTT